MECAPKESDCHQKSKMSGIDGELSMTITTKSNPAANPVTRNEEDQVVSGSKI